MPENPFLAQEQTPLRRRLISLKGATLEAKHLAHPFFGSRPRREKVRALTVISTKRKGFTTKSLPPYKADCARDFKSLWLVTKTTGVVRLGVDSWILVQTEKPSMPGIWTSRKMTSKRF